MLLTLIAVSMAFILSHSFLARQAPTGAIVRNISNHSNARAIAETGLELAITEVKRNATWRTDFSHGVWTSDEAYAGGTFTISGEDGVDTDGDSIPDGDGDLADDPTDPLTLTVVGKFDGITHTVRAEMSPTFSNGVTVLMVVVDPASLTSQEEDRKSKLTSFGYAVTAIASTASQGDFDTEVASADVAYIPEHILDNNLGTKLRQADVGVVNEANALLNEMGLLNGSASPVSSTLIDIVVATHYITTPFTTGNLTICTSTQELTDAGGNLGVAVTLAESDANNAGLATLEKGDSLNGGGGTTPARRVFLPWGGSGFDFNSLNADALTIFERSFEWAMGFRLLLVVIDPASLTSQEAAKKSLFESWGYTVSLTDVLDPQASFDAAVAVNDVAYITEDINATDLNTKLKSTTIGVVNEEVNLTDDFGMSATLIWLPPADTIEITNTTHYITSTFTAGPLLISTSNQPVTALDGTPAGGLEVLGEFGASKPGLSVINTGGNLYGGGTAAGRRVDLPWGGNVFDINSLNAAGLLIVRRS